MTDTKNIKYKFSLYVYFGKASLFFSHRILAKLTGSIVVQINVLTIKMFDKEPYFDCITVTAARDIFLNN